MVEYVPPTDSDPLPFRLPAAGRHRRLLAVLAVLALSLPPARAGDTMVMEIPAAFDDVDAALVDAIADEGIGTPSVSHFGAMLARTATDLGHRPDLYTEARIYTFCSAAIAARLATESAHNVALCPLSIAVYRVPEHPRAIYLSYRRSTVSAGGQAADALMQRIVTRTALEFGISSAPSRR